MDIDLILRKDLKWNNRGAINMTTVIENKSAITVHKSLFVTIEAWIFIIINGFIVLLLSTVYRKIVNLPINEMTEILKINEFGKLTPKMVVFWFPVSLCMFFVSLGLLKRSNLARKVFIGFLILFFSMALYSPFIPYRLLSELQAYSGIPEIEALKMKVTFICIYIGAAAMVLCLLLIWNIKKLLSNKIRSEFA